MFCHQSSSKEEQVQRHPENVCSVIHFFLISLNIVGKGVDEALPVILHMSDTLLGSCNI